MDKDLMALVEKAKHDPEGAYEDLKRIIDRESLDQGPMTGDEFTIMKRFESGAFPEDQEYLTPKQTVDLMSAWFKRDRQSREA